MQKIKFDELDDLLEYDELREISGGCGGNSYVGGSAFYTGMSDGNYGGGGGSFNNWKSYVYGSSGSSGSSGTSSNSGASFSFSSSQGSCNCGNNNSSSYQVTNFQQDVVKSFYSLNPGTYTNNNSSNNNSNNNSAFNNSFFNANNNGLTNNNVFNGGGIKNNTISNLLLDFRNSVVIKNPNSPLNGIQITLPKVINATKPNNPVKTNLVIKGDAKALDEYEKMLSASTGYKFDIVDNKLTILGKDESFKGKTSQTLMDTINKFINTKDAITLNIVGDKTDDKNTFIDSFRDAKIDLTDLKKIGDVSTALQGAAIGHFLNEITENPNYAKSTPDERDRIFDKSHNPSLDVETKVLSELLGKTDLKNRQETITPKFKDGYATYTWDYGSNTKFEITQSGTEKREIKIEKHTLPGGFVYEGKVEVITTKYTGELKDIKKL